MKLLRWVMLAAVVFAAGCWAIDTHQKPVEFRATTLDGEKVSSASLKGKVVLVQFWATWCKFCRADQEAVDSITADYKDRGLVVLAVNVGESRKKVKRYLEDSPRACKIVLTEDTNLAAMFPVDGFPGYVLMDRDGKVVGKVSGAGGNGALRTFLRKAGLEE